MLSPICRAALPKSSTPADCPERRFVAWIAAHGSADLANGCRRRAVSRLVSCRSRRVRIARARSCSRCRRFRARRMRRYSRDRTNSAAYLELLGGHVPGVPRSMISPRSSSIAAVSSAMRLRSCSISGDQGRREEEPGGERGAVGISTRLTRSGPSRRVAAERDGCRDERRHYSFDRAPTYVSLRRHLD
jgi:hypothetical protein